MNNNKLLIATKKVYPGYIAANLTIGQYYYNGYNGDTPAYRVGFSKVDNYGALNPDEGFTHIYIESDSKEPDPSASFGSASSNYLIYNGKSFSNWDLYELYRDWYSRVGQTVTVYLKIS